MDERLRDVERVDPRDISRLVGDMRRRKDSHDHDPWNTFNPPDRAERKARYRKESRAEQRRRGK